MKFKTTLSFALLLGGLAGMASANAADPVKGFYLGGSLGMSRVDGSTNFSDMHMVDKTDLAVSVRTGYRFHTNFAVEGGYADLGKSKYRQTGWPDGTIKTNVWHLDAVGIFPLVDKMAVFGKLGVAQVNFKDDGYKEHRTLPHLGLGVSYAVAPALSLRAEYDNYGKAKFSSGSYSADLRSSQFSLGVDYRF